MSFRCEDCGQVLQSEGSFGLHQLNAHVFGRSRSGRAFRPPEPAAAAATDAAGGAKAPVGASPVMMALVSCMAIVMLVLVAVVA